MSMKKKVKCKCRICGKTFLVTKGEKIFMEYYAAVVCNGCMGKFADDMIDRVEKYIFGGNNNECK